MSRRVSLWLLTINSIFLLFAMPVSISAKDITFRGRVIDSETKEPIEGVVVVASWLEARPTISGESTRLKDVRETLTDRNGEWSITGEEGQPNTEHPYYHFFTGTYYTRTPSFIIFKPGYCSWPEGFYIEACQGKMKSIGEFTVTRTFELPKLTRRERMIMIRNIPSLGMASGSIESLPLFKRLVEQEESEIPGR